MTYWMALLWAAIPSTTPLPKQKGVLNRIVGQILLGQNKIKRAQLSFALPMPMETWRSTH